jgi:O-antigen biosynthesis protein WbqV
VMRLALAMTITAAAFVVVVFLANRAIALPRSTVVLTALFSLTFMVGVRVFWRLRWNPSLAFGLFSGAKQPGTPLTVVGNIRQAESYLRRWAAGIDHDYRPIAIVTDERRSVGQLIHGIPVTGGIHDLVRQLTTSASHPDGGAVLFLADPITSLGLTTADIGRLRVEGYRLLRQSSAVELNVGDGAGSLREIELEEFLPRAPLRLDSGPLAALIAGRRALVTGAGGSIGSEIARQLVRFGCSHLTLIDHSEFALFEIDRELQRSAPERLTHRAVLCNVRDASRVREVFVADRPELVFHAAALKHVTLVEGNPAEAVLTNVLGTWNVATAAREAAVEHMVMISTDKAVDPSSVMGCTKRLAESLLGSHAGGRTLFSVVRFGNVLGSAGSVVPIFRDQIERGGPITVTHPDVERYFMTIPEAVQLVLQATALRAADQDRIGLRKFILEMGKPVKIVDLARQMIELSGDKDRIRIDFIGLRQGEKITESLIDIGERATSAAPGIAEIDAETAELMIGEAEVVSLAETALRCDGAVTAARVKALARSVRQPASERITVRAGRASAAG